MSENYAVHICRTATCKAMKRTGTMVLLSSHRSPQARDQKAAEPRESTREKLDALVKDTASKLTPEKTPKAKSKAKKGPEL